MYNSIFLNEDKQEKISHHLDIAGTASTFRDNVSITVWEKNEIFLIEVKEDYVLKESYEIERKGNFHYLLNLIDKIFLENEIYKLGGNIIWSSKSSFLPSKQFNNEDNMPDY